MINTHTGQIYNDNNVVNANDLRKRLINIDSKFRVNLSDPVGDYQYRLEHTYKNIIRMRVASVEIPNTFYTFSSVRKNTTFRIQTADINNIPQLLTVVIPDGNYTAGELVDYIQNEFNIFRDATGIFLSITLNINSGRITITNEGNKVLPIVSGDTPTANARPTIISFENIDPTIKRHGGLGLAYNLGFRSLRYEPDPTTSGPLTTYTITGEAIIDVVEDQYLLMGINDFHTVDHKTDTNYLQEFAKIIIREDKNAVIYDDGAALVSNEIIFPQPQNLSVLQIKLYDSYGYIIELNGLNYSMTLEITEVTNTQLYQFYRNYIWFGSVPRIPPHSTNNAGSTLLNGIGPAF